MDKRWRQRSAAALGTIPLAFGLSLSAATTAQASDATYDCEFVTLHSILVNTPVNGYPCTGPVGVQPAGSVMEVPTGRLYSCQSLEGIPWDGQLFVFGNICEEV
jgi:hypothetical protein